MAKQTLEQALLEAGYRNLFYFGEDGAAKDIWLKGKRKKKLKKLIKAEGSDLHAKFLAPEVLRTYGVRIPKKT
jgi:hypothetical protein